MKTEKLDRLIIAADRIRTRWYLFYAEITSLSPKDLSRLVAEDGEIEAIAKKIQLHIPSKNRAKSAGRKKASRRIEDRKGA